MNRYDDPDDSEHDGLPDAAFTEDELAAGVQYLVRGTTPPSRNDLRQSERQKDPTSHFFTTYQEAVAWAKINPGQSIARAPEGNGFISKVGKSTGLRNANNSNLKKDTAGFRRSGIYKDSLPSVWDLLSQISYSEIGELKLEKLRHVLCIIRNEQVQSIQDNLLKLLRPSRYSRSWHMPWHLRVGEPNGKIKITIGEAIVLIGYDEANIIKQHDQQVLLDELSARLASANGAEYEKARSHISSAFVDFSDPDWRNKLVSVRFWAFISLRNFYIKIGYKESKTVDLTLVRSVLSGGNPDELKYLRDRFQKCIRELQKCFSLENLYSDAYELYDAGVSGGEIYPRSKANSILFNERKPQIIEDAKIILSELNAFIQR